MTPGVPQSTPGVPQVTPGVPQVTPSVLHIKPCIDKHMTMFKQIFNTNIKNVITKQK